MSVHKETHEHNEASKLILETWQYATKSGRCEIDSCARPTVVGTVQYETMQQKLTYLEHCKQRCEVAKCKDSSRYRCPRCQTPYCSLNCYKNHSSFCVQNFSHDQLSNILGNPDDEDITETLMLDEDTDGDVGDEREIEELESMLEVLETGDEGVDVDGLVEGMSKELRKKFEEGLREGKCGEWLQAWKPWWEEEGGRSVGDDEADGSIVKKASVLLRWSVVEVVYGYCLVLRLYDGSWDSEGVKTFRDLRKVSEVLGGDRRYASGEEVLCAVIARSRCQDILGGSSLSKRIDLTMDNSLEGVKDVCKVLQYPGGLNCVMRDVKKMANQCRRITREKEQRKEIALIWKKIEFMASWCSSASSATIKDMYEKCSNFLESRRRHVNAIKRDEVILEKPFPAERALRRPSIQEIT